MKELIKNTSIKILAEKLNLSKGTISKALKDSYEISTATKIKVLEAAKELNYVPNHFASGLKSKKSKNIAVIIPEIVDSFFSLAIDGIEKTVQENDFHISIHITNDLLSKEINIVNTLLGGRVDGVLISISNENSDYAHLKKLIDANIPVVFFDRDLEIVNSTKVLTNDFESGYLATKHLIDSGCANIYFLSTSNCLSIINKRFEGFKLALNEHGINSTEDFYIHFDNQENTILKLRNLFSRRMKKPDSVIASVESLIIPIYNTCKELNIQIPNALKVIGFSNLPYANILSPSLSTITQPAFEIGCRSAEIICRAIINNKEVEKETIICNSILEKRLSSYFED